MLIRSPRTLVCTLLVLGACEIDPPALTSTADLGAFASAAASATAASNTNNTLSSTLSVLVPGATAARIATVDGAKTLYTPIYPLDADGTANIPVLGLAASTKYEHHVQSFDGTTQVGDAVVESTSGALPSEISTMHLQMTSFAGKPRVGYYLVGGVTNSTFATDETGDVRWYHELGGANEETKMQTDGTFTTTVGASQGWQAVPSSYVRYTPSGAPIATYTATTPDATESNAVVYGDLHELLLTSDGTGAEHLHFIAYEMRPKSASDPTLAAWHELVRQAPDGTVEFQWKTWSRFTAADVTEIIPVPGAEDTDHANALAIDPTDGNYVMSFRDLDALVKIDSTTGNVIWQLGGVQNQFTIVGDPFNGFYGQHSLRVLDNGHLLIYDNGLHHKPAQSRAVEYALDTTAMTATMVWEYRHYPDAVFTPIIGSVERFQDGHTLVAFSDLGLVDEVDADGTLLWEGSLLLANAPVPAYRIRFLPSLYEYLQP